jgi:hypothetical protein
MNFQFGKKGNYNYLELTPLSKHNYELSEDGSITVLVPRFSGKILGKLIQPRLKSPYVKANFDEFGSAVWLLMNGENTVEQIGTELRNKFGESIEPVFERLTQFLTGLYNHGLISFIELKKGN